MANVRAASSRPVRRTTGSIPWSALAAVLLVACGGAGEVSPAGTEASGLAALGVATQATPDAILGFEAASAWHPLQAQVATSAARTQGQAALAVRPRDDEFTLVSDAMPASTPALAGLTAPAAAVLLDYAAPAGIPDSYLTLTVACGLLFPRVRLPPIHLANARPGAFTTAAFPIGAPARAALSRLPCPNLRLLVDVSTEADERDDDASAVAGATFLLDNLRVRSSATPPPGAGRSVDLTAVAAYAPPSSQPGQASFPLAAVQVPAAFHVKLGSSGQGSATLQLGWLGGPLTTCSYAASGGGTGYALTSCSGGAQAGDLLPAEVASLSLAAGDPSAGPTKVKAQLAANPLGDQLGAGLLPAMPTFWGDTPATSSQIATDYFAQVNASPPTGERWIRAPVPDFARRHGTGAPHDNLTGPPPAPGDPPFDQEGHMNPGGSWDAYWRMAGDLTPAFTGDRFQSHFGAELSAHAVVWGDDIPIVSLTTSADTDSGLLVPGGPVGAASSEAMRAMIFGVELPHVLSGDPSTGFTFHAGETDTEDLPPISIWIFEITFGISASAGLDASGTVDPTGFDLSVGPSASVGVHVEGGIDIGVAAGSVSADIQLLEAAVPLSAHGNWIISTDPGVCAARFPVLLDGQLQLSTLGGEVDLNARFGVCPFCDHETWTLFSWDGIDLGTQPLFHVVDQSLSIPLPSSLCLVNLTASIVNPAAGSSAFAGASVALLGAAARPGAPGGNGFPGLPTPVGCNEGTWAWSANPADMTVESGGGCDPTVHFATSGPHTLTLQVTDQFGETGTATRDFTVAAMPNVPFARIDSPVNNWVYGSAQASIPLVGTVVGEPLLQQQWSISPPNGQVVQSSSCTGLICATTYTWQPDINKSGFFTVTLTPLDPAGIPDSHTVFLPALIH